MMSGPRTLWRLSGSLSTDTGAWSQGLALHIQHSPLTMVAMRIGDTQRSYLLLHGCGRCLRGNCAIGCPTTLFGRLVRASLTNGQIQPVLEPQGLAVRPHTHAALCWPTRQAQPLSDALLERWPEARLALHWSHILGRLCVGGLLLTTGHDPAPDLQAQGWWTLRIPTPLLPWLNRQVMPLALPGVPWRDEPFVLFSRKHVDRFDPEAAAA